MADYQYKFVMFFGFAYIPLEHLNVLLTDVGVIDISEVALFSYRVVELPLFLHMDFEVCDA